MSPARAVGCVSLAMFAIGLGDGAFLTGDASSHVDEVAGLTIAYICLLWYRYDRDARGLRLSRLLSAAVFLLPLAAIPFYLLRSRELTQRGNALGVYLGILLLMLLAQWMGILAHQAIR